MESTGYDLYWNFTTFFSRKMTLFFSITSRLIKGGPYKQGKEEHKQKLFTYSTYYTWKVLSLHKARTWPSLTLEIMTINVRFLNAFVLNWTLKAYMDIKIHKQYYYLKNERYTTISPVFALKYKSIYIV